MSDTSKATPRPWRLEDGYLMVPLESPWREDAWEGNSIADANMELIIAAVNSYNPERDKLARELAEHYLEAFGLPSNPKDDDTMQARCRQLLKLYEEEK